MLGLLRFASVGLLCWAAGTAQAIILHISLRVMIRPDILGGLCKLKGALICERST